MGCGDVNAYTRVTEVQGHKDAHNREIGLLYSSLDHHCFGKTFLVLPCEEELFVVLLKPGKLQSDSGRCCWGCPSAAGGTGTGKGVKSPFYHLKSPIYHLSHVLVTGPNLTSRPYSSSLLPALSFSLIELFLMCSAQSH